MSKILIVDDSATMRKILMRVIRQAGIACEGFMEASNGSEGLERLNAEAGVQLVLSDINMPVMNGIDFVKAVRAQPDRGNITILMVTTEGSEAMVKTAMEAGASGYVTKPFTPETIRAALEGIGK
ncbi:MAG: response regulator [Planctomycetes bacterium]|nr:response regulator [Planctomycetota bacterium]